jgi:hypothetical protein
MFERMFAKPNGAIISSRYGATKSHLSALYVMWPEVSVKCLPYVIACQVHLLLVRPGSPSVIRPNPRTRGLRRIPAAKHGLQVERSSVPALVDARSNTLEESGAGSQESSQRSCNKPRSGSNMQRDNSTAPSMETSSKRRASQAAAPSPAMAWWRLMPATTLKIPKIEGVGASTVIERNQRWIFLNN